MPLAKHNQRSSVLLSSAPGGVGLKSAPGVGAGARRWWGAADLQSQVCGPWLLTAYTPHTTPSKGIFSLAANALFPPNVIPGQSGAALARVALTPRPAPELRSPVRIATQVNSSCVRGCYFLEGVSPNPGDVIRKYFLFGTLICSPETPSPPVLRTQQVLLRRGGKYRPKAGGRDPAFFLGFMFWNNSPSFPSVTLLS